MRIVHLLTVALALAATHALLTETCRAGEPSAAARAGIDALIDGAAKAASCDAVLSATRRVREDGDADAVLRLVGALRARRGYASVRALSTLATDTDPRVREAVMYAIADIGLRVADAMYDVRTSKTDESAAVRGAAYAALGAVGDASDVPALLDDLASGNRDTARWSGDALRAITGATLRNSERLWRQWWKDTQQDAVARLNKAWEALENNSDATEASEARVVVDRMAWLDIDGATRHVSAWLDAADAKSRCEAYRLASKLRLGDLAEPVRLALGFEHDDEARRLGGECAAMLGGAVQASANLVARTR
jgi:hypothetical protein